MTPIIGAMANGWFASSVSIRSASVASPTDRVLRLTRLCRSPAEALAYAHAEALRWLRLPPSAAAA